MQAGRLRHRVEIQTFTETQDTFGEPDRTWATADTVWAAIEPLRGQELLSAQEINAETSHRVRLRYHSSVTPTARFKFGTRIFDILSVINWQERGASLEVLCTETH